MLRRWSLVSQFRLLSLAILVVGMLLIGAWVGREIDTGVLSQSAAVTALYVESIVVPHLQSLVDQPRLTPPEVAALDRLLKDARFGDQIVAFKVWSRDGTVLYSPDQALVGRAFPLDGGLARAALEGEVTAHLTDLSAQENEGERQRWDRLLEVYVPIREHGGDRIIAVTEVYQRPDDLERQVAAARLRSWGVVGLATLLMYGLLAGLIQRASDTMARQQTALHDKVADLSRLLTQNRRLHERVRQAGERTTALNEQALRRVSADLHDGPGQALALALLRLETLGEHCATGGPADRDFAIVHGAVRDALFELRAIAAGLRLPELAALSPNDVAERAVHAHEKRSGTPVAVTLQDLPATAPLPVKIALFRALQEALSNATRHGGGVGVTARVWGQANLLHLAVSDRGPGFQLTRMDGNGHLGLAGMRERAELLGGSFRIDSVAGHGTTVEIVWPLERSERP